MKCNKCGGPIMPGENYCRFCGSRDFSERKKKPEVVDIREEILKDDSLAGFPDLSDIINLNKRIDIEDEEIKTPEIIDVEPSTEISKTEEVEAIKTVEQVDLPSEQDIKQDDIETTQVLEEEHKPEELKKQEKKGHSQKETANNNLGMVFLSVFLACSLIGNVFLAVNGGNRKVKAESKTTATDSSYSKVSYDNYNMTIPSTWITENNEDNLLIYDDTENWAANVQVVSNISYDDFVKDKDKVIENLGALKYQFTSNYSKEVENKEFYLFKGKYYEYSVYVIATKINRENLLVTDLKFKGEVDDILLNAILTANGTIMEKNTKDLFKDNFEFKNLSSSIDSTNKKSNE